MFDLTGRVALVTGASRGLGRAACLALAGAGADVVVTDLLVESDPDLQARARAANSAHAELFAAQHVVHTERTSEEIRQLGRRSAALRLDVTDREQVDSVVRRAVDEFGSLDILVNSASAGDHLGQIDQQDDGLWTRDLEVNLTGAFNCSRAAFAHMRTRGFGRLVFMASVAATQGGFAQASYAASTSGLVGLGRSLALEGARFGITANVVAPGIVATEASRVGDARIRDRMVLRTAMRAAGEPEDVAAAVVYLSSPEARYVTGQVLHVAGGMDLFTF